MQVQWYPGHMTKARRMLEDNVKVVDAAMVLLDARAPHASWNPDMARLLAGRSCIIILNKADLADPAATAEWKKYFGKKGFEVLEMTSTKKGERAKVMRAIESAVRFRVEAAKKRGIKKVVRIMTVGIPNVGKSTFINMVAGQAAAKSEDRPGVTRGRQWIKIGPYLELMDTPGLLWPKFDDEETGMHLAFCGSVNDDIIDTELLVKLLLEKLADIAPKNLMERYKFDVLPETGEEMLEMICKKRGFILKGGITDIERGIRIILDEFRGGKIGRISLERPADYLMEQND